MAAEKSGEMENLRMAKTAGEQKIREQPKATGDAKRSKREKESERKNAVGQNLGLAGNGSGGKTGVNGKWPGGKKTGRAKFEAR